MTVSSSRPEGRAPLAAIFGLAGAALGADERAFFRDCDPAGFILFRRNCETPDQVCALVAELRAAVGRADAPVLIDQEGGRVQRLRAPLWRETPPAWRYHELALRDPARGAEAARCGGRLVAAQLAELGITVDCAPVLDVRQTDAHEVIGDRAFGDAPFGVAALARAFAEGLLEGGVLPVVKHVPGHGRARADSHMELPVVEASRAELERVDFAPFRALRDMPWAMTAHVLYAALDPDRPATTSPAVVGTVIRETIGFDGVLVSDDLCMKALAGGMEERTRASLAAGCDLVLHCDGNLAGMKRVAAAAAPLTPGAVRRLAAGEAMRRSGGGLDAGMEEARLAELLGAPVA